jgi:hypothetical protein
MFDKPKIGGLPKYAVLIKGIVYMKFEYCPWRCELEMDVDRLWPVG